MSKREPYAEVHLSAYSTEEEPILQRSAQGERPFIIAVLGDFVGLESGNETEVPQVAEKPILTIDRDNFDTVVARTGVRWKGTLRGLPGGEDLSSTARLTFRSMEDFHPDSIVQQIAGLRALLQTRRGLEDPAEYKRIAGLVSGWLQPETEPSAPPAPQQVPSKEKALPPDVDSSDLLDSILGQADTAPPPPPGAAWERELKSFVQKAVQPHLVDVDTDERDSLIEAVDQALSALVQQVLHDPGFQQLESLWRGLYWLVSDAETGPELKIQIIPVSKTEILQDLETEAPVERTGLGRLLIEPATIPGSNSPALLVGAYDFCHLADDLKVLSHFGQVAQRLGAPFVAAASPRLLGAGSFEELGDESEIKAVLADAEHEGWRELQSRPWASWIGLALPRILLRLPYGSKTLTTEGFDLEEDLESDRHKKLLWGNPAFGIAIAVEQLFGYEGWSLQLSGRNIRLQNLPLYLYEEDGRKVIQPCGEILLNEWMMEVLVEASLIPVISYKNQDLVALPYLQAVASPRRSLKWA